MAAQPNYVRIRRTDFLEGEAVEWEGAPIPETVAVQAVIQLRKRDVEVRRNTVYSILLSGGKVIPVPADPEM